MHRPGHNDMGYNNFLDTYNNPTDAFNNYLAPRVDQYSNPINYKNDVTGSFGGGGGSSISKQVPNLDNQNRNVGMNAGETVTNALTNSSSAIIPQQTGALPETMSGQSPIETTSAVADATKWTDKVDIGNVLGAGMMVGSNLMASKNFDDTIDDIDEGLKGITGMINSQNQDTINRIKSLEGDARSSIDATADQSNLRLGETLTKLNRSNISTGSIRRLSNDVREKLNKNLDSTSKNIFAKTENAIRGANISNRASIDKIRVLQEQLKAKKKQAQKDKEGAKWGAYVGGASLVADVFVPGSGQVMRSGYSTYSRYS
tara:strand:- start:825 stop:1772 length:948 start_codon:yes stop_codon:yes gene_type:complete